MSYVLGWVFHIYPVPNPHGDSIRHKLNPPYFLRGNWERGVYSTNSIQYESQVFFSFSPFYPIPHLKGLNWLQEHMTCFLNSHFEKWWEIHILSICWHEKNFLSLRCSEIPNKHCSLSPGCFIFSNWGREYPASSWILRFRGGLMNKDEWVCIFQKTNKSCPSRIKENYSKLRST